MSMFMSRINLNWGIYESDIIYMGGQVVYTGECFNSRGNVLEKAFVILNGITCEVCMARFRDGNAVISDFMNNGKIVKSKGEFENVGIKVQEFIEAYYDMIDKDEDFMMCVFWRRTKQYFTVFAQGLCVVFLGFAIYAFRSHRYHPVLPLTLAICSTGLFFVLGTFYKYYRNKGPK